MRIAGLIGALLLSAASSALAADVRWVLSMGWRGDLVLSTHPDYQDCRRALDARRQTLGNVLYREHQGGLPPAELTTVLACWPESVVQVETKKSRPPARHHDDRYDLPSTVIGPPQSR